MQLEEIQVVKYLEFDPDEYRQRRDTLRAHATEEFDVVIVTSPETLRYFSGYHSLLSRSHWRSVFLAIPMDSHFDPVLIVPEQEHGVASSTSVWDDLSIVFESVRNGHQDAIEVFVEILRSRGLDKARIGMELGFGQRLGMTINEFERFRSLVPDASIGDAATSLWATRAVKSPTEIDYLRRACEITCHGVRTMFEQLSAGMTEREGHHLMLEAMATAGAEEVWITFGSRAMGYAAFNSPPSDQVLERGDLVWVDGGAKYRGYQCDFIRTAVIAEPSPDQVRWYNVALEANRVGVEKLRPGAVFSDIFSAVRDYLGSQDFLSGWGLDVLGHGVGLEIHELPSITEHSQECLLPGHVVTMEPSLSPPGHSHGHYIAEEVVAITDQGRENLTVDLPPDLWVTEE